MPSTMNSVEVITRVERRRRWSREEKQRLVAESARPDRTVSQVARAHGVAANLLFTWRRQFLAAAVAGDGATARFVPVRLAEKIPVAGDGDRVARGRLAARDQAAERDRDQHHR